MAARVTPSRGAKPDKLARDAIMVALNREMEGSDGRPTKRLYAIADKLTQLAAEGDISAIKEVFDRVDGKASQPMEHDIHMNPLQQLMDDVAKNGRTLPITS